MTATRIASEAPMQQAPAGERVTQIFARLLGKREESAHKILYAHPPLHQIVGLALRAYRLAGDFVGHQRFLNRMNQVQGADTVPLLTDRLELEEQRADGREDETQLAYHLHPTPATAKARILAIDANVALLLEERAALAAKHGFDA